MRLSDGNLLFIYNSATEAENSYHVGWLILDGDDPTNILQRSNEPLLGPEGIDWQVGLAPALCNVPNVTFLEAAHPTETENEFRVYFGGADTVIGTALIQVETSG